ncbi:MAG: hypothetical protein AB7K52_01980 [Phycisphaerales bacterium]
MNPPTNHPELEHGETPEPRLPRSMVRDLSALVGSRGRDVPDDLAAEVRLAAEAHFRPRSRVATLGRLGGFAAAAAAVIVVGVFVFRPGTPPQPSGGGLALRDDASRPAGNVRLSGRSRAAAEIAPVRGDVNADGLVDVRDALALGVALRASPADRSLFQDASGTPTSHAFGIDAHAPSHDAAAAGEPDALASMFQLGDANADGVLDERDVEAITRAAVGAEQLPAIDQPAENGLAAAKRELQERSAEPPADRAEEAARKTLTNEPSPPPPHAPAEVTKDTARGRGPPPARPASGTPTPTEPAAAPDSGAGTTPSPLSVPPQEEWVDLVINPQGIPLAAYQVEFEPPVRPGFQARVVEVQGGTHPAFSAATFAEAPGRADANIRTLNFVGLSFAPPSGLPTGPTRVARFRVRYEAVPDSWTTVGERLRQLEQKAGAKEAGQAGVPAGRDAREPAATPAQEGQDVWKNLTRHITAATRMGQLIPLEVRLVPTEPGAPP